MATVRPRYPVPPHYTEVSRIAKLQSELEAERIKVAQLTARNEDLEGIVARVTKLVQE